MLMSWINVIEMPANTTVGRNKNEGNQSLPNEKLCNDKYTSKNRKKGGISRML